MVQVPADRSVTVVPLTVHTLVVVLANETVSVLEAVALMVNGATVTTLSAMVGKVMLWAIPSTRALSATAVLV